MIRLWILTAALLALALVACGPDCVKYCSKLDTCAQELVPPQRTDIGNCLAACEDVGQERAETIGCVIDHSCAQLQAKVCDPTGGNPATLP